jgi:hypothetical protein
MSSHEIIARLGRGSTTWGVIGLFVVGVSQIPLAIAVNTNVTYRVYEFGQTIGFIALGVGFLAAIPFITMKRQQFS